ncbi:Alpha-L-arabinofuranosidase [Filimonas lacunae]|uniref:non-reducing end alpha-L-arabinofuranosidase n=1 Tax=Filimonas lacunae TaxID=477680 RepID=A0A173MMU0_9BACT|nr:alpha-L-arabinofuranosidase C-terminal domain-containing protein [Filimonas lacunae]BAV08698.1 alpha-N-acetylglucosaminidase [Filimonas lacunae]SIS60186.1 Alpha-L-arabinofuranosidase [Filimonas lacunae]
MRKFNFLSLSLLAGLYASHSQAQKTFTVKVNEPVVAIQPTMWGVFFEDINFGADGGIYAEMVKNRSFEFSKPLMGWATKRKQEGDLLVLHRKEQTNNPRYLHLTARNAAQGDLELTNEGFRGMGVKKGLRYDLSFQYRQPATGITLHIALQNSKGEVIGSTVVKPADGDNQWHKQAVSFQATDTAVKGKLNIWLEGTGTIDVDMISLFPGDTWKNRPGGMRGDMVQLLADMKPGFIRFPGGCIVEGFDLSNRYQWKKTIGPVEERQLMINRWNVEFPHRSASDYFQTFGLGFFEYFQLAEDIGAEPLPILNCGMACQFNTAELVPMEDLQPYVQDALDLIEFANGDVTTQWGKVRASMGHPKPFHLKMMGVGNENWGPQYIERLKVFTKAIKEKYSDFKIVNSSGTDPDKDRFAYLNKELRSMNADIIDEHYYRAPEWFLANASRYDSYDRNGSKVFAGEYAAHSKGIGSNAGINVNNWRAALAEAAFMTGLERNAAVVNMASYAPLFANTDAWQWAPDLIWVNSLGVYGTADYHVQKLFSLNKGTKVLPLTWDGKAIAGQDSIYASACIDEKTKEVIFKIANVSAKPQNPVLQLEGIKSVATVAESIVVKGDLNDVNSLETPDKIAPQYATVAVKNKKVATTLAPYSFTIIKVKMQ